MKKLKERLKNAGRKLEAVVDSLLLTRERKERAVDHLHNLHDTIDKVQEERKRYHDNLEAQKASNNPDPARIRELERKLQDSAKRLSELHKQVQSKDVKRDKAVARAHSLAEARKFWVKRKTILRKKIKKAREQQSNGQPKYESWMANGHPDNVSQGVKDFIARGVVNYGLTCTSLYRNYVPPGGSTTSYHLSGHAGDIAGARMTEFQLDEYKRNLGNSGCWELFGPDNSHNLKYGGSLYLPEGSPLENLHDSHVHGAF